MQLSTEQDIALQRVNNWFKNESRTQQVFKLFGPAGTGKSTLAKHFAQNIDGTVKFAAFTGKAAHVMAKKGCEGASTIHRLIYQPKITSKNKLQDLEKELLDLQNIPPEQQDEELIAKTKYEIYEEQQNAGRMSFSLNLQSDLRFAKLLIIDEISMLNTQMGKDLESFGVPILVLGDPEQLPPIYGEGYYTQSAPDILLNQIHRQALDNPIIAMSQLIRQGKPLPLGTYGDSRVVADKLEAEDIINHDMILTGLRKTKRACDTKCRAILNYANPYPMQHDRLMCVKNNHDLGLLNGQIWKMASDSVELGDGTLSLHLLDPETQEEMATTASEKLFHGQPLSRWEHEDDIQEFEYAYAITVHKSQGSQWDNVLVFDQKDCFSNWSLKDRQRWLYTGITRAAERVTVMRL